MKKKILLLADNLGNGGAERQLLLLAQNIPDTWDIFLWSMAGGPFLEQVLCAKIKHKITTRKFRFDISPLFDLYKLVKNYRPDVIHSWGWMSTMAGIFVSKTFKIPLVNGIIRSGKPYYYRGSFSKLLSKWGDVVVSNSQAGLNNWRVNSSQGVVIYNGFDQTRLVDMNRTEVNFQKNDGIFRVVMAARMVPAKDFSLFISAARKLTEKGITNWKFSAIGHGETKESLMKENMDLIHKGILDFPDAGFEVIPYLRKSNVGVLLTNSTLHEEGCSNTIMEYLACGLPSIVTDNGGNKEIITHNKTGFIIGDNDLDGLISTLLWIYDNPIKAHEIAEAGKKRLLTDFSIENMVLKTITTYENIITGK